MPENEFEKQVQQKMDELQFAPSAVVWAEVEKQIPRRKKRRLLLIWFPFLLLMLGGLAWMYRSGFVTKNGNEITAPKDVSAVVLKNNKQKTGIPVKENKKNARLMHADTAGAVKKIISAESRSGPGIENTTTRTNAYQKAVSHKTNLPEKKNLPGEAFAIRRATQKKNSSGLQKNNSHTDDIAAEAAAEKNSHARKNNKSPKPSFSTKEDGVIADVEEPEKENQRPDESILQDDDKTLASARVNNITRLPVAAVTIKATGTDHANGTAKNKSPGKQNKMEWGINAGAGVSKIFNGFSGLLSAVPSYDPSSFAGLQSNSNSVGTPGFNNKNASDVKPGFAFTTGVFINKKIGRNLKLSAAFNYNYYSTVLRTGDKKTDTSSAQLQYNTGNSRTYTNRFHFISVPVTIEKQLGSLSRFSVNGGMAFSVLAGSNALQYDGQKNSYYIDNSRINKTQWSLLAGFHYRLLQKRFKLETGPQVNYYLSNIFKKELYGSRHLFFAGISTKIFFGKK